MTGHGRTCEYCGEGFNGRADKRFCSDRCRDRANRAAHGAAVDNPALASQRRNSTKAAQSFERVCLCCGKSFTVNGKAGRRVYCSSRCKRKRFNELHKGE